MTSYFFFFFFFSPNPFCSTTRALSSPSNGAIQQTTQQHRYAPCDRCQCDGVLRSICVFIFFCRCLRMNLTSAAMERRRNRRCRPSRQTNTPCVSRMRAHVGRYIKCMVGYYSKQTVCAVVRRRTPFLPAQQQHTQADLAWGEKSPHLQMGMRCDDKAHLDAFGEESGRRRALTATRVVHKAALVRVLHSYGRLPKGS